MESNDENPRSIRHDALKPGCDDVRRALERAGCRHTRQRAEVYACLVQSPSHPTAEEVFQAVRGRLPRISLATVYKALEALVEAGLAAKLPYNSGSSRYDCRADDHYHFRDTQTGEVHDLSIDFDPHLLAKIDPTLIDQLGRDGFRVTGYRLEVLGQSAPKPPA